MKRLAWLMALAAAGALCRRGDELDELNRQLAVVKRVYVDRFNGGESAAQLRDMIIASLQSVKLFVITEDPERADAILRGSGEDLVYTDTFQSGENIGARTNLGVGKGTSSRSRDYFSVGGGVNDSEQSKIQERKHEASASVRLVNKSGDVIWSTTQESQGAKFRSASADVADKISRELAAEIVKAGGRSKPAAAGVAGAATSAGASGAAARPPAQ